MRGNGERVEEMGEDLVNLNNIVSMVIGKTINLLVGKLSGLNLMNQKEN